MDYTLQWNGNTSVPHPLLCPSPLGDPSMQLLSQRQQIRWHMLPDTYTVLAMVKDPHRGSKLWPWAGATP